MGTNGVCSVVPLSVALTLAEGHEFTQNKKNRRVQSPTHVSSCNISTSA